MRWNNNHANTINYRALIRLAFAMAIIAAMLMAILDHHQESSPAISSERITQLNQALRKKLSHDLGTVPCQVDRLNNKNYLALPKRNSVAVRSFLVFEINLSVKYLMPSLT